MTLRYRFQQGIWALFAFSQPVDTRLAQQTLSPELFSLFEKLQKSEQLHSLKVLQTVMRQTAVTSQALKNAALLHDCGKIRYPLSVAQKTFVVLVRRFKPALFERMTQGDPENLIYRPFVANRHHPQWSGDSLREVGADDDTIWLATHHADSLDLWQNHPLYDDLARLQKADDQH